MTKVFLTRPVLAAVCSLVILIAGLVVMPTLPLAQYPQIAPPVVTISASYVGASPQAVEAQVTTPLEQAVNTVQGLRYISSQSTQGTSTITCTFTLETNLDIAAADVQNLVQSAIGQLPATVQQVGVQVSKNSGSFVLGIALTSSSQPARHALLEQLRPAQHRQRPLARFRASHKSSSSVSGSTRCGSGSIRICLPSKVSMPATSSPRCRSRTPRSPAAASARPPNRKNQPYTYTVNALTQLSSPQQFANIILRANPNGGFTRLGDVARVELGAENYNSSLRFNGNGDVVGLGVQQYPTANALQVSKGVIAEMNLLAKQFPPGIHCTVAFDTTDFVAESVREVVITLLLSIFLVVLVIYVFLQNPRSTLIPAVTIPVSLIGTFFVMKIFGFTINTITLFGLTLATGLSSTTRSS